MVVHCCNPSIQETKAGGWRVQASLGYTAKPCLMQINKRKEIDKWKR
jgi:hypothetical protein